MARSIDSGSMGYEQRREKIIALRKKLSNSAGEYDQQTLHDSYRAWLMQTPAAIDFDALAKQDVERADREARPYGMHVAQGSLFEAEGDSIFPYGDNQRVALDKAGRKHFIGWQSILQKNFTSQANAYNKAMEDINAVLTGFELHRKCKSFGQLRQYLRKKDGGEEEKKA